MAQEEDQATPEPRGGRSAARLPGARQFGSALAVSSLLDPALHAAAQAGSPAILVAIAAGARTTEEVIDLLIAAGLPPETLPPAVADLVDARLHNYVLQAHPPLTQQGGPAAVMPASQGQGAPLLPLGANAAGAVARALTRAEAEVAEQLVAVTLAGALSLADWLALSAAEQQDLVDALGAHGHRLCTEGADDVMTLLIAMEEDHQLDDGAHEQVREILSAVWDWTDIEPAHRAAGQLDEPQRAYAQRLLMANSKIEYGMASLRATDCASAALRHGRGEEAKAQINQAVRHARRAAAPLASDGRPVRPEPNRPQLRR